MKKMILTMALVAGAAMTAPADVDVNVNIGLPVLAVGPDPVMAVVPGTYVYFVADLDGDLFFYQGYWWRVHKGRWHRSAAAGGPWKFFRKVPHPLLNLPPGWRNLPPGHARLKHSEVKRNWKQWEKEKRWDKKEVQGAKKDEPAKAKDDGPKGKKTGAKPKGGKGR